jgi:hypothetical protein
MLGKRNKRKRTNNPHGKIFLTKNEEKKQEKKEEEKNDYSII